ncbi:MAG: tripartite tricarboxylate transporter substrate binding protein [Hyphomicrobiaceae bacterium]|nr:tripartite tricarboxylate transporter substrate binding protein [Hyphomicrobiaceae bacterium]
MPHFRKLACAAAAVLAVAASTPALAVYPEKPITLIVPYSPGGASDQAARALAAATAAKLGPNQIIVVNKDGAGGIIGANEVYKSKPDGYTLLLARVGTHTAVPAVRATPYDPMNWAILGMLETNPVTCATSKDKPYKTYQDLINAIKKTPDEITYSSAGPGTILHLSSVMLLEKAKVGDPMKVATHIPYKGGGPAALAAVKGEVDFVCQSYNEMSAHVRSGALRALVVLGNEKLTDLPDVPTSKELGIEGMEIAIGWSGLLGPPNMDPAAVKFWVDLLGEVKNDKAWQDGVKRLGSIPSIWSPAETKSFMQSALDKMKQIATSLGIKL